jgi:hypothetical protein
MLLEEILTENPNSAAMLLRRDMYAEGEQGHLVRDVLALANGATTKSRHLLLGAEQVGDAIQVCGLDRDAIRRFRLFGYDLPALIEPELKIVPIMVEVEGKPVAALEISDCNNPPYTLRRQIAEDMRTGACWVRDQGVIRPARREDLDRMYGRGPAEPPTPLQLGFNNDPTCQQLELQVPDSSQSPSSQTRERILSVINTKKASNKMLGYDDTGILRLSHVRIFGPDTPFVQHGMDTLVMQYKQASDDSKEADEHYYFEECAVQINLSIQNPQQVSLQDIVVELSIPKVSGFEVADRLHSSPEKQMTEMESRLAGYPRVDISEKHAKVSACVGTLGPGQVLPVFEMPLRIAVGPEMRGMKVAIKYHMTSQDLEEDLQGRLKLIFAR